MIHLCIGPCPAVENENYSITFKFLIISIGMYYVVFTQNSCLFSAWSLVETLNNFKHLLMPTILQTEFEVFFLQLVIQRRYFIIPILRYCRKHLILIDATIYPY